MLQREARYKINTSERGVEYYFSKTRRIEKEHLFENVLTQTHVRIIIYPEYKNDSPITVLAHLDESVHIRI